MLSKGVLYYLPCRIPPGLELSQPFAKSTCISAVPASTNISGLFALRAYLKKQPNLEQTLLYKR